MGAEDSEGFADPGAPWPAATPVPGRQVLAARRTLLPRRSTLSTANTVYTGVFALAILGVVLWRVWDAIISSVVDLAVPAQDVLGTGLLLLVILGVLRYCTWQGFASFPEPDCAHLLTAPVRRSELVRPRLLRVGLLLGATGALVGVLVSLALHLHAAPLRFVAEAAAGFAFGVILVAAGWQVQRAPRVERWVQRLTLVAIAAAVLLAYAEHLGGAARYVALWSGPWGWAVVPLATRAWAATAVSLVLLWCCAVAGWIGLARTSGACSIEGFRRRARTRSRAVAAIYSFDTRGVLKTARGEHATWWRARLRLPATRAASLAVTSHTAVALLRSPMRLAWGCALAIGGVLLLAITPVHVAAAWAGGLVLYLSAAALLEPLRVEVDSPFVSQVLLPWRYGRVLLLHCLPAVVLIVVVGLLGAGIACAAGLADAGAFALVAVVILPLTCVVVASAALSGRRGGTIPSEVLLLTSGDTMGMSVVTIFFWLFSWTILAILCVGLALTLLTLHGLHFEGAAGVAAGFAALAALLARVLAGSRR